ncbi:MAG: dipicolinate synthase, partial [Kineothrix sp.]|nr:dipicolinate synthase [Kineothrix sp.]
VSVCGNSAPELAMAEALGIEVLPLKKLGEKIGEFEYIYNTIPAIVLGEEILEKVDDDALIIDIASGRGGLDYKEAEEKVNALHCLGLPGKYAAKVSAQKLSEYVMSLQ